MSRFFVADESLTEEHPYMEVCISMERKAARKQPCCHCLDIVQQLQFIRIVQRLIP